MYIFALQIYPKALCIPALKRFSLCVTFRKITDFFGFSGQIPGKTQQMNKGFQQTVSVYVFFDTRRKKANGKYPVKLRAYTSSPIEKRKDYPTRFEFSKDEFQAIWESDRPRGKNRELREELQAVEAHAREVSHQIHPFTFEGFERKLYQQVGKGANLIYQYEKRIQELNKDERIKNRQLHENTLKSFDEFSQSRRQKLQDLTLTAITADWLDEYETFMLERKDRSPTTVGIYLRTLRSVFNTAIEEGEVSREFYPFGKRKYTIPSGRKVKKALSREQLKSLFNAEPNTPEQGKAKDFWFFSYFCNGMNVKDIARLRFKDIDEEQIQFIRAKTERATKGNQRQIVVIQNDFTRNVIARYGNTRKSPQQLVFNVLKGNETPEDEVRRVQNFTRYINQHMKKLCKAYGLPEEISTYWARHTFATMAIQAGVTLEQLQEGLDHRNIKTTQNYVAGFPLEAKKKLAASLMNFND